MADIPLHKAVQQSDFGIFAKEVSPFSPNRLINYTHRDSYYIFGIVESGTCRVGIDFKDCDLSAGSVICTQPHQVHRIVDKGDAKSFLLFIDGVFIDAPTKQILAEYALSPIPFKISDTQRTELIQLFSMILRRIGERENDESKTVLQNLACTVVGIITDAARKIIGQESKNRRHIEITLAFKELLSENEQINRNVSHYAESLHISPVYLNEVVKNVTGVSVSRYIQNELILHAKRMLVYTSLTVREISIHLGIDDYAYFTRLFTKAVGISPTLYRKNTSNSAILTLHSLFFYLSMHCNFANKKMNRNRFIYFTDLMLLLVFILSFYTGVELHIAGQGVDHESWHIWAIFHTNASLLFMILGIIHVKSHWAWYKGLRTVGCKGKRKAVLLLSIVFLLAVVSGILLVCFVDGANSSLGLWHYRIGVFVSVLGVLHILKRKRGLYKGVRRHVLGKGEGRNEFLPF